MTEMNPFAGGFDMNALLQQAQAMQEQVVAAQHELSETEVDGTVSDGLVTVTVNGTGELVRVKIRSNSFDPADTEDLEDMIVAAYRDARARADDKAAEALGPIAGALGQLGADPGAALNTDTGTDKGTDTGGGGQPRPPLGF